MSTALPSEDRSAMTRRYEALRAELHRLGEAPEPDQPAIDRVLDELNTASAAYREASTGIIGNNPDDDY